VSDRQCWTPLSRSGIPYPKLSVTTTRNFWYWGQSEVYKIAVSCGLSESPLRLVHRACQLLLAATFDMRGKFRDRQYSHCPYSSGNRITHEMSIFAKEAGWICNIWGQIQACQKSFKKNAWHCSKATAVIQVGMRYLAC
jgi:hypothetical protein